MSYFGSKFPEGINPTDYREIAGIRDITCPLFRKIALKSLSSNDTTAFNCDGCGTSEALIIVIDLETERIFTRRDSRCDVPVLVETRKVK